MTTEVNLVTADSRVLEEGDLKKLQFLLWDFFGEREVFSESPDTFFDNFDFWIYRDGVFFYRLRGDYEWAHEPLDSMTFEERNNNCNGYNFLFKNVRLHDPLESLIYPTAKDDRDVHIMGILDPFNKEYDVLENERSIKEENVDLYKREY
jgi:hypothetical protein